MSGSAHITDESGYEKWEVNKSGVFYFSFYFSLIGMKKKTVAGVAQRVVHYEHDNSGYCYSVYDISESLNRRNLTSSSISRT